MLTMLQHLPLPTAAVAKGAAVDWSARIHEATSSRLHPEIWT